MPWVQYMVLFLYTTAFGVSQAIFGQGTGPAFLTNMRCTGTESSLLSCSRSGTPFCSLYYGVGVVCPPC